MDKYKDNTMSEVSILKQREAQKRWREKNVSKRKKYELLRATDIKQNDNW